MLEQYASTLGISSDSYGDTEAVNAAQAVLSNSNALASPLAAASSSCNPLDVLQWLLGGTGNYSSGLGGPFGLSSNLGNLFNIGGGNWASAGSDLLGMAGGGLLDTAAASDTGDAAAAAGAADLAASTGPAHCRWRHGRHGRDADGRDGPGDHGQQAVGAADLGRLGHSCSGHRRRAAADGRAGPPPHRRPAQERSSPGCREWARWRATARASARRATASSRSSCRKRRPCSGQLDRSPSTEPKDFTPIRRDTENGS